jgi:hypothetical protein
MPRHQAGRGNKAGKGLYIWYCTNIHNQSNWENAHRWLKEEAELFHRTFATRIKTLPALDGVAEDNDVA